MPEIPLSNVTPLHQIIIDYWDDFSDVEDLSELKGILKILNKRGEAQGIEKHAAEEIWSAIETHRSQDGEDFVGEADIKDPEWNVLIEPNPPTDYPHFMSKKTVLRRGLRHILIEFYS